MDALHVSAWPLLQLLLLQGVQFASQPPSTTALLLAAQDSSPSLSLSPPPTHLPALPRLRDACFDLIAEQLRLCADQLTGRRGDFEGPSASPACSAEPVKVEAMAFRYLLLLLPLVTHLPPACDTRPRFLSCVASLLICGSPRIQRLCLRALRTLLPHTPPRRMDEVLRRLGPKAGHGPIKEGPSGGAVGGLVHWILQRMASVLAKASGASASHDHQTRHDP